MIVGVTIDYEKELVGTEGDFVKASSHGIKK
jgi:hypothetical protein